MTLVQPIIIDKSGTHEDTIEAVMQASFMMYALRDPTTQTAWNEWLAGPFVKSVRRVSNFAKFLDDTGDLQAHRMIFKVNDSQVAAFMPMEEFPAPIQRAQVAGTELERKGWTHVEDYSITFAINPRLNMTTGKTAAQCAHAYFSYCFNHGLVTTFNITDHSAVFDHMRFNRILNADAYVEIHDAGFTEIPAGSLTVIAGPNPVRKKKEE